MSTTTTAGALIGTCEAARVLGVHRNTIRHWAENGILRACALPTGARRFDPEDVERVRAQIHSQAGKGSVLWSAADGERQILVRVKRGGILIGEGELRYQLEHKDAHPLAQADELIGVLDELEARGLVKAELYFRLTAGGRALLGTDESEG